MTALPMNPPAVETIELLSGAGSPRPLFVLLHDAGGMALDMLELGNRLGDAFAEAAVLMPEGLSLPAADAPVSAVTACARSNSVSACCSPIPRWSVLAPAPAWHWR